MTRRAPLATGPLATMAEAIMQHADDVMIRRSWPTPLVVAELVKRPGWEGWNEINHMMRVMIRAAAGFTV